MKEIKISTNRRTDFVEISSQIEEIVREWDMQSGILTVYVPHTTAGITINENADPDVMIDLDKALDGLVPWRAGYRHAEGNSAAHLKASMMGFSVQLIVDGGKLRRGTWQGIYFCEFDGPRSRRAWVSRS